MANSISRLVVMIPAFNEEKTIAQAVKGVSRGIAGARETKVIVVDDGSKDSTAAAAKSAGADAVVMHGANRGLGIAFKSGINKALEMKADVIVNMDADLQFNPADIPRLIKPILDGEADVVTCSRFLDRSLQPEMPLVKRLGNSIFTGIVNWFTNQRFTDTQCGFRAYSREAALRMTLFGKFTYTQESLLDLVQKGMRVKEVACRVKGSRQGKSKIVRSWWSYGIKALIIIIRAMRDYKPLKFFGSIGALALAIGIVQALFLALHWLATGKTSPYTSLVPVAGLFIMLGFLLIVVALIADMLDRQRKIQEEILYQLRKKNSE